MMRTLRDKKTMKAILWFVILCFVVGFIFLAVGSKFQLADNKDPNLMAKVGEKKITYDEFNKAYQASIDRYYRSGGDSPSAEESKAIKEEILERLIDDAILAQTAQKLGVGVSDEEMASAIQRQPYFLDDNGKFSKTKYYDALRNAQLTPETFEASQRQQLLMQKINSILADAVLYTNDELVQYDAFLNRDLKATYVRLETAAYENRVNFTTEELKAYYESNKSQYDHPERAKVRHLLIALQGNENIQDQEKAKSTLEEYRKQVLSGKAKFTDLIRKNSQDSSSKDKGGSLGWMLRGRMGKDFQDFEDAIFHLKPGEISKPVKSPYGFHLLQLEDHESAYKSTFEGIRSKIVKQYKNEKAVQKMTSISEKLVERLKKNESLEKAAGELGLPISTTSWFNRKSGIPGLKSSKDKAEELAELYPKEWKGPIFSDQTEYFFQLVDAREAEKNQPPDLATSDIGSRLLNQRLQSWLKSFMADQRKKLNVKTYSNG